jgi:hypothetical protein
MHVNNPDPGNNLNSHYPKIGFKAITLISAFLLAQELLFSQENIFKFQGQFDSYAGMNFTDAVQFQTGARIIPSLSAGKTFKNNLRFDSEISLNCYTDYHFTDWENDLISNGVEPYRLWLRLSSERFELRAGLQKISFGSASLLRPLMWFDRMDPRDPLQMTNGVYSVLGRYYFQNNVNAWLWVLWGNDKTKGWDLVPSAAKIPELGGRIQFPIPKGELGISYHHRTADLTGIMDPAMLTGISNYPEDRIGFDEKWDLGIGLWIESSIVHSTLDTAYFQPWTKLLTLGLDYTFSLGNGLYLASEFFDYNTGNKLLESDYHKTFSSLLVSYPLGIYKISAILNYYWTDNTWYRFVDLQRQSDKWTFHMFLFWNPEKVLIYNSGASNNIFAGKGFQAMAVYNF